MKKFPTAPGAYALHLHLEEQSQIRVGRLGERLFPPAEYIYLGSALGPGGLHARLERHLSNNSEKRNHWHIDYLRKYCEVRCIYYLAWQAHKNQAIHLECAWSQILIMSPGGSVPVKHFGASDCRSGCPAHLVSFPKVEEKGVSDFIDTIQQILSNTMQNKNITTDRSKVLFELQKPK